jgi:hypothetical protein
MSFAIESIVRAVKFRLSGMHMHMALTKSRYKSIRLVDRTP